MSARPPPDDATLKAAAAWHARLNTRSVSSAALEDFRVWRQRPGARAAYAVIERLWRQAGRLGGDAQIDQAIGEARTRGSDARASGPRAWRRPGATAIAGLLAAAGVVVVTALAWPQLIGRTFATGVGEERLIQLEDGSRLRLDTRTRLNVRFTSRLRQVRLIEGQAYFEVAHDPRRPLVVIAGDTAVRAVGTRFDVRREGAQVRVTLVQGLVEVRQGAGAAGGGDHGAVWLRPGQGLIADRSLSPPTAVDAAAATSWTSGRIVFHAVPLQTAVAEVNRYSRRRIVLSAHAPGEMAVTGVFDTGDVAAFVMAVRDLDGLIARDQPNGDVLLMEKAGAEPGG